MISGAIRRCKKLFLILVFIVAIVILLFLKLSHSKKDEEETHSKRNWRNNEYVDKNGISVIVGHYVGNLGYNKTKLPDEILNSNNFAPDPKAGRNGQPVIVPSKDFIKMQQLYQINQFNLLASDRIPLNRSLPDYRRKMCTALFKDYLNYPKTSIIIVFHNEAWSTLLRTVWSVINRSPKELIKEIILVDDASQRDFLKKPLEDYIRNLPVKVTLIRSAIRIGLIKARLMGASQAAGEVLTFLDAHCECTTGWLEPLLSVIHDDKTTVVCPTIDIINDDTFAYVKSFELHWGAFNWNLQFRWYTLGDNEIKLRKQNITRPFHSPVMAGGLFAVDKEYFYRMGGYDEDMLIWGGENLEMSFRLWQCGGRIEISPCSRVGHIFRKSSPYGFPGGLDRTLFSNLARVALVWLDDWADFFFKFNEQPRSVRANQNVTKRLELKRKLKCKNFSWYLSNVWPQHFFPTDDRFFGRIKNVGRNKCLLKPDRKDLSNQPVGVATLNLCLGDDVQIEMFIMTQEGLIMTDDSLCLDAPNKPSADAIEVRIVACHKFPRQKWRYHAKTKEIRHNSSNKCLDVKLGAKENIILVECDGSVNQKWILEPVPWR
ncbi:unnamed protein product [Phyllotreta striolata]|uniref:Polypeptide N-acetylgalactosaminyltransferase n=1 Tax=Phyllotreta striolata TaxID=444603 RepID=A0A9N9TRF8_PHYSR|nr:unnamed protein product [Phyllotreta striolata]